MTIIMPCFIINGELESLTRRAIESLKMPEVTLLVVDNASTQGGGYLRSVADIYIRNRENLGFAKAVNQGLKLSKTELTAVANNDIIASPNWFDAVNTIALRANIGSIHPRMIDYDQPFAYGNNIVYKGKERWCTGSFFILKRRGQEGYQLYDEDFLNTYDDWDYFKRLRDSGLNTVYTDIACYKHHHSFTQKLIPEREENNKRNGEIFRKKWGDTAENLFAKEYPDQMAIDYREGFEI